MFISCTSSENTSIFSKQHIRNSKFCTFLEKWGAKEGAKKRKIDVSGTFAQP